MEPEKKKMIGSNLVRQTDSSPTMVSGNSSYNYANNSSVQRKMTDVMKPRIEELIAKKLDLGFGGDTFRVADLGCSIGPNTFLNVEHIVQQVRHKYQTMSPPSSLPEFQVFFNDQINNDFNALFRSLPPERDYFAAGVPGSFYTRLFPKSFLHMAHSASSAHWLSRVPTEVVDRGSPAWNRGMIHYGFAPKPVEDAYRVQFRKDMGGFLKARSEELVSGGMLVLVMSGVPDGMHHSETQFSSVLSCVNLSLLDLVRQGVLEEDQLDNFNLPIYFPHPWEMRELVEENQCFSCIELEVVSPESTWLQQGGVGLRGWAVAMRAGMEELFARHFGGEEILDRIFDGASQKIAERAEVIMNTKCKELPLLYVALQRK
ncbi:unnamed protein product [Linum tenue]|uniref:Uncharacterized protein n=2 Tax=Linum tenue TaxID=586396 RepID=A0AAV0M5E2_9ROSI|nr:unnamed protein product [Linum tenue]